MADISPYIAAPTPEPDYLAPVTMVGLSAGDPSVTDVNYSTFDPFSAGNISLNGGFPTPTGGGMPGADGSNLPTSANANPNPTGDWMTTVTALAQSATKGMNAFVPAGPTTGVPVARMPVGSTYYSTAARQMPSFSSKTIMLVLVIGLGLAWIVYHHRSA